MLRKANLSDVQALKANFEMIYESEKHNSLYPKGHSKYYEMPSRNKKELVYVSIYKDTIIGYFYAYIENNKASDIVTINFYTKPIPTFAIDMYKFIKLLISKVESATFYSLKSSQGEILDTKIIKKLNGRIFPNGNEQVVLKDGSVQNMIKYEILRENIGGDNEN